MSGKDMAPTTLEKYAKQVSVIIPSKDGRTTIDRALESLVLSAPYIREVFIVYSNSPPEYTEACRKLPARYQEHFEVKLIDSGPKSNGSIARNAPLSIAQGAYTAFLDDDDEWFDGKLHAYFLFMEERQIKGNFVLFSTVIGCQEDKTQPHLLPSRPYKGEPIAEFILSFGGGAQTSALLMPTSLAHAVQFDPKLPRHQDYDFCMRLAEHGAPFYHLEAPMSYWYQRGNVAAKGGTFEFYTTWILANKNRLSSRAYSAYVGKELFAAARASGEWPAFWKFLSKHLTISERINLIAQLNMRALRSLVRHSSKIRTR